MEAEFRREAEQSGRVWMDMTDVERVEVVAVWREIKGSGATLRGVWEDWKAGRAKGPQVLTTKKTLGAAVSEVIASKKSASRRMRYVNELESCLGRFIRGRESADCASITAMDIEAWLARRPLAPVTRMTELGRLSALFSFCVRRKYRPDNPVEAVDKPTVEMKAPRILTVEEAGAVLRHCPPEARAWFGLAMFGGIRPEEMDWVGWDAVDLEAGVVRIDAAGSKVRQRRLVHLRPGVGAWLGRMKEAGSVLPLSFSDRRRVRLGVRDALGWAAWPQDVLRHTATSYWLAVEPDAARLALELGNSPAMIFRHYRELVRREDAERFWGLVSVP